MDPDFSLGGGGNFENFLKIKNFLKIISKNINGLRPCWTIVKIKNNFILRQNNPFIFFERIFWTFKINLKLLLLLLF